MQRTRQTARLCQYPWLIDQIDKLQVSPFGPTTVGSRDDKVTLGQPKSAAGPYPKAGGGVACRKSKVRLVFRVLVGTPGVGAKRTCGQHPLACAGPRLIDAYASFHIRNPPIVIP